MSRDPPRTTAPSPTTEIAAAGTRPSRRSDRDKLTRLGEARIQRRSTESPRHRSARAPNTEVSRTSRTYRRDQRAAEAARPALLPEGRVPSQYRTASSRYGRSITAEAAVLPHPRRRSCGASRARRAEAHPRRRERNPTIRPDRPEGRPASTFPDNRSHPFPRRTLTPHRSGDSGCLVELPGGCGDKSPRLQEVSTFAVMPLAETSDSRRVRVAKHSRVAATHCKQHVDTRNWLPCTHPPRLPLPGTAVAEYAKKVPCFRAFLR